MSDLLIDKVKKQKEESFGTWFERWFKKNNFEKVLIDSASQGYSAYRIVISESVHDDKYIKRRLRDKRTVELLSSALPGFKVEYVKDSGVNDFFGLKRHWEKDYLIITW